MVLHMKSLMHTISNLRLRGQTSAFRRSSQTRTVATTHVPSEWKGLQAWRNSPVNEKRRWGLKGPDDSHSYFQSPSGMKYEKVGSLAEWGALVLSTADPASKAWLSHEAYKQLCHQQLPIGVFTSPEKPARPEKPLLVSPKDIPSPKNSPLPHNAYVLHNLAHIELNAIDLAWDTVVRFSTASDILGSQFFSDFAHVADDESRHFSWCSQRLADLGFSYGDMPAHNILWKECQRTSDSVSARLAVIPMVQEARGLDAGPRLVQRLVGLGDERTSHIVALITEEEVAHVAVGVSWFMQVCKKMGRNPDKIFRELIGELDIELKGPFNYAARTDAGLPREWYDTSNLGLPKGGKHLNVREGMTSVVNTAKKEFCSTPYNPTSNEGIKTIDSELSEVYERLACVVSMERENFKQ